MQVDKNEPSLESKKLTFSEKEIVLLAEIGLNEVPTATDFVEYASEQYKMSQSGIWYTLKKLKKVGMLDFTEKGEAYRPLALTEGGMRVLRNSMMPVNRVDKNVTGVAEIQV
jgi:DNA-binding PadR family transcriptional regulator